MSTLAVRPALPQDEIFLYELYSAVRAPEFALAPVTPAQKEHLMRMQFRGQMSSYAQMFPNSCCHVVMLDGNPAGRLWVAMLESEYHLVDIAVHPDLQSKASAPCSSSGCSRKPRRPGSPFVAPSSGSIPAHCAFISA